MSRSASLHTLPLTRKVRPEWVITEVNLGPANLRPERLHPQTCFGRAHWRRSCWRAFIQKVKHTNISAAQQLDVCSENLLRFTSVKNINEWGRCSCWAVRWCLYMYSRHTDTHIYFWSTQRRLPVFIACRGCQSFNKREINQNYFTSNPRLCSALCSEFFMDCNVEVP